MRILVTGAAGFLGSVCVNRLLSGGGHQVITTDKVGVVDHRGDLTDPAFIRSLPEVDALLHCAGVQYFSAGIPILGRREYFYHNNAIGTKHLTERYANQKTHFVYVSTSMVYEMNGVDITIHSPRKDNGIYSASKIAAEGFVEKMRNPSSVIVPCIIAGQGRGGLFRMLVHSMKHFHVALYPHKATHPIQLINVEDVADLASLILNQRAIGRFNAAHPEPTSLEMCIHEVETELQISKLRHISIPLKAIESFAQVLGYLPLAQEQLLMLRYPHIIRSDESQALGWTPQRTNEETIQETVRALCQS